MTERIPLTGIFPSQTQFLYLSTRIENKDTSLRKSKMSASLFKRYIPIFFFLELYLLLSKFRYFIAWCASNFSKFTTYYGNNLLQELVWTDISTTKFPDSNYFDEMKSCRNDAECLTRTTSKYSKLMRPYTNHDQTLKDYTRSEIVFTTFRT